MKLNKKLFRQNNFEAQHKSESLPLTHKELPLIDSNAGRKKAHAGSGKDLINLGPLGHCLPLHGASQYVFCWICNNRGTSRFPCMSESLTRHQALLFYFPARRNNVGNFINPFAGLSRRLVGQLSSYL